jgi:hypothetical protein
MEGVFDKEFVMTNGASAVEAERPHPPTDCEVSGDPVFDMDDGVWPH